MTMNLQLVALVAEALAADLLADQAELGPEEALRQAQGLLDETGQETEILTEADMTPSWLTAILAENPAVQATAGVNQAQLMTMQAQAPDPQSPERTAWRHRIVSMVMKNRTTMST